MPITPVAGNLRIDQQTSDHATLTDSAIIAQDIPARVADDTAPQNARIEQDRVLHNVLLELLFNATDQMADHTTLYKQFSDNPPSNAGSPTPASIKPILRRATRELGRSHELYSPYAEPYQQRNQLKRD